MPDPRPAPQLRQIALSIRDWIGPFYTLGAVVAFVILLLSALDPSGALVLWVRGVLLAAAGLALLLFFGWRERAGPWTQRFFDVHGHWILSLVAVFFAAGLTVSHWLQNRHALPAVSTTSSGQEVAAPAPPQSARLPAAPVVSTASTVSTAVTRATPDDALVDPPPMSSAPPGTKAAAPSEPPGLTGPPVRATQRKPTVEARAPLDPRCQRLVQRSGVGEALNGEEIAYLRSSCGG
jgi:hypothetical protein